MTILALNIVAMVRHCVTYGVVCAVFALPLTAEAQAPRGVREALASLPLDGPVQAADLPVTLGSVLWPGFQRLCTQEHALRPDGVETPLAAPVCTSIDRPSPNDPGLLTLRRQGATVGMTITARRSHDRGFEVIGLDLDPGSDVAEREGDIRFSVERALHQLDISPNGEIVISKTSEFSWGEQSVRPMDGQLSVFGSLWGTPNMLPDDSMQTTFAAPCRVTGRSVYARQPVLVALCSSGFGLGAAIDVTRVMRIAIEPRSRLVVASVSVNLMATRKAPEPTPMAGAGGNWTDAIFTTIRRTRLE